jgi:predicted acyl esterase
VKLVNARPEGNTHNPVNRIVPASRWTGSERAPQALTANEATKIELDLGATAVIAPRNHQLRDQISWSDFSHYARNLSTGLNSNSTSDMIAQQRIFHDADRQSYIEPPVARITR